SQAKNELLGPEQYPSRSYFDEVVRRCFIRYEELLRRSNGLDFDDLIGKTVQLLQSDGGALAHWRDRFRYLLVDEYQDTNRAQYVLTRLIAEEHRNIAVVGDDDQSIYGWRGADIRNILDFEKDFPAALVVRLEQNYRSTSRILDAANQVIAQNVRRKGKTLRTDAGPGELLTRVEALDEADEAGWIVAEIEERVHQGASGQAGGAKSFRDFTILYRTNAQLRALEEAMLRAKMPYQIVGGVRFFERREIMDLLAYLRLISNPRDAGAFDRIVNYPKRGIGDTSLAKIMSWAAAQDISPLEAASRAREVPELTSGAANALVAFSEMIGRYRALSLHVGVGELMERLLEDTGFFQALQDEGPEGEDRIDNVKELLSDAHEFQELPPEAPDPEAENAAELTSLDLYLQQVALLTDVDKHDPEADRVTLMTAHNAKGLEFPFVFIAGLEDGLFPLARAAGTACGGHSLQLPEPDPPGPGRGEAHAAAGAAAGAERTALEDGDRARLGRLHRRVVRSFRAPPARAARRPGLRARHRLHGRAGHAALHQGGAGAAPAFRPGRDPGADRARAGDQGRDRLRQRRPQEGRAALRQPAEGAVGDDARYVRGCPARRGAGAAPPLRLRGGEADRAAERHPGARHRAGGGRHRGRAARACHHLAGPPARRRRARRHAGAASIRPRPGLGGRLLHSAPAGRHGVR
ncbi:MAG TPA: 3'-5' exonuclease, partial [Longimicrobiales bacterium]